MQAPLLCLNILILHSLTILLLPLKEPAFFLWNFPLSGSFASFLVLDAFIHLFSRAFCLNSHAGSSGSLTQAVSKMFTTEEEDDYEDEEVGFLKLSLKSAILKERERERPILSVKTRTTPRLPRILE